MKNDSYSSHELASPEILFCSESMKTSSPCKQFDHRTRLFNRWKDSLLRKQTAGLSLRTENSSQPGGTRRFSSVSGDLRADPFLLGDFFLSWVEQGPQVVPIRSGHVPVEIWPFYGFFGLWQTAL